MSKVEEGVDAATGRVITVVVGSKNPVKVAYVARGCGSPRTVDVTVAFQQQGMS